MRTLIQDLGEPDAMELPKQDEPSPAGQWFRWNTGDGQDTLIALGDDYSPDEPNYRAPVRLIAFRANKEGMARKTVFGLEVNRTTRAEVRKRLAGVYPSALASSGLLGERGYFVSSLQLNRNGVYTYLLFDVHDILVGVAQATFSVDGAD